MAHPPHIPHEGDVREVITDQVTLLGASGVKVLDRNPIARTFFGSIYAPSNVTTGHLVLEITGPDETVYPVTLQAADILDCDLAQAAINAVIPDPGLVYVFPANINTPHDGQMMIIADGYWLESDNVSVEATSSTFNVGVLGEDVGALTMYLGRAPLDLPPGTLGLFEDILFYRGPEYWYQLSDGISTYSNSGLSLSTGESGPNAQSIVLFPTWGSMSLNVKNDPNGRNVDVYLMTNSGLNSGVQITTKSPEGGQSSIFFCAGTVDPSAGDGLMAQPGALYHRLVNDGASPSELWFQTSSDPITWVKLTP